MKKLAVWVLLIVCVIAAGWPRQIAAATGGLPFADENRETGKGESEKQRQKER